MKCVLISINPKWCEMIASGKKTVEVRKTRPKIETPFKVYIYETRAQCDRPIMLDFGGLDFHGRGQVIGEFVCDCAFIMWDGYAENQGDDCLTFYEREKYLQGKDGYGWHISNLVIYEQPKELSEFRTLCKYRNDDGSCQYTKVECDCVKFDFNPDYSVNFAKCCDYISRPPKSWCYVEEVSE